MIKICICDDSNLELSNAYNIVTNHFKQNLNISIDELAPTDIQQILANDSFQYNIAILDIEMGEINGIEIAKEINQLDKTCHIIFLTNYTSYISESYDTEHIYYVLKDQVKVFLPKALEKAISKITASTEEYVTIVSSRVTYVLPTKEILYIEKSGRTTIVHTTSNQYHTYTSLNQLLDKLPSSFCKCHNSYVANFQHVQGTTSSEIKLKNQESLPLGRQYTKSFRANYLDYIS